MFYKTAHLSALRLISYMILLALLALDFIIYPTLFKMFFNFGKSFKKFPISL